MVTLLVIGIMTQQIQKEFIEVSRYQNFPNTFNM